MDVLFIWLFSIENNIGVEFRYLKISGGYIRIEFDESGQIPES